MNSGLEISVIEANNILRKIERGWGEGEGLSMIAAYTKVYNELG